MISHRVWQDLYHSDPAIVGKPIRFAEVATTIAGVAPRDFDTPHGADFWFSQQLDQGRHQSLLRRLHAAQARRDDRARRTPRWRRSWRGLARDFPASDLNRAYVTKPLVASIVGDLGPILIIVMSATGLLLLLACVNVTNLLLARGAARAREMAVRVALGAGARTDRPPAAHRVGAAVATRARCSASLLAYRRRARAAGARRVEAAAPRRGDRSTAACCCSRWRRSSSAALLVGFAPALRLAGTDVRTLMNESSRSTSGGRGTARWLSAMTVVEIALAIMLVAGAGWLVRGFAGPAQHGPRLRRRAAPDLRRLVPRPEVSERRRGSRSRRSTLLDRLAALPGRHGGRRDVELPAEERT